ncbi:zinc ribbon domain-containing protein [Paucibacter sp. AS339]|uniref:zinc ribbon domain-containing protein n=1 Tax=Paucibacter hankyongi TaxID=3133434 RepID=UPI0030984D97
MSSAPRPSAAQQAPQPSQQQATREQVRTQASNGCPACHEPLLPGALFCTECGHALDCPCPQCGANVGGGDFCEACGFWLKAGQCRYCYASLVQGAAFCTECGNHQQQGLSCARCHTQGFFDFCGTCGDPLSELALGLVQAPPDDPALAQALQQLRQLGAEAQQALQAQHAQPSQPARSAPRPAAPPPSLNLSGALQSLRAASALDAAAAQRARESAAQARQEAQAQEAAARAQALQAEQEQAQQAARQGELAQSTASAFGLSMQLQQARERIQALLAASEQRSFPDAQTARRYFMQLRSQLVREGQVPGKWLCNWANCLHDNPNDCGNPSLGGRWMFD